MMKIIIQTETKKCSKDDIAIMELECSKAFLTVKVDFTKN